MEVKINETVYGTGKGRNKKSAQQEAAKIADEAFQINEE
jgi:dsRNA-specific ribonuclease